MKIDEAQNREGRPLWEGHRERLRRRMEREGWDALKPFEMVELVLCHAVPRQDLSDVARLLVDRFGTVGGVFGATREQLMEVPGMTATLAEWIGLTGGLIRAYRDTHSLNDIRLSCYQEVLAFLKPRLDRGDGAGLWALYADFSFNLITYDELREAPKWWDAANVRRMTVEAIGNGARYLYLVLWPQGGADGMSVEDVARLNAIVATLNAADLDLVDCLLVNGGEVYSMRIHGKMNDVRERPGCRAVHERYAADR